MLRMERLSTGIDGLNRILGGGIPKGSWVVVLGRPGSGKSTMGRLFLMYLPASKRQTLHPNHILIHAVA
ncbi:MAG: hypothetical protein NXY59_10045 [Aigarchaeota archaeon]|nr:hypothetical protein [Candidatus Pelearchaeum maunauluense]